VSGLPRQRIHVIPNGVEPPKVDDYDGSRRQIRQRLGIDTDTVLFGSVGRLADVKNFDGLLKAIAAAQQSPRKFHVVLVGDGPSRKSLEEQLRVLRLGDRVHFAGHQDEVGQWLAAMDVYINCSHSEGLSQGVLEALSMGIPLIVTDVGDHLHVVRGAEPCGLVVPRGDTAALANAIEQMANDLDLRRATGAGARERYCSAYSLPSMVRAYTELYQSLNGC
jgi:glycosyltransferase involved in cell wall biosynthesis